MEAEKRNSIVLINLSYELSLKLSYKINAMSFSKLTYRYAYEKFAYLMQKRKNQN